MSLGPIVLNTRASPLGKVSQNLKAWRGEQEMQIQKTIDEFIGEKVVPILTTKATVTEAIVSMTNSGSACVLVTDDEKLVGIFTERDFLTRVAAPKRSPGSTALVDVMTKGPDALKRTDYITYAVNLMAVGGYRNVPIVDDAHRPVGNLSVYDVTSHLARIFSDVGGDSGPDEWTDIGGG